MYENELVCFAASYFTLKTLGYMIGMPLSGTRQFVDGLSNTSAEHYENVKNDRRIKGYISILLGLLLGMYVYKSNSDIKGVQENIVCLSLFAGFFSMSIFYESMWQNKFLFEDKNIEDLFKDNKCDKSDVKDIKIYAEIYQKHRLVGNIVEVSSICISLIITLIIYPNK